MKKFLLIAIGIVVIGVSAFIYATQSGQDNTGSNETANIKQMVHDYTVGNLKAQNASITSHQLIVTNNDSSKVTYNLPADDFFVSIAPFVETTHPCTIHSLTGCQGEMTNEQFNVFIEDTEGHVYIDQDILSQANGFIDLWLPRDNMYRVYIEHNGAEAKSEISTFKDDDTCITTMQLN